MHKVPVDVISLFIFGAAVLAFVYHVVLLYFGKDKLLWHYLAYLFFTALFVGSQTELVGHFFGENAEAKMLWYAKEALQIVYLTAYFNFIIEAIAISRKHELFLFRKWPYFATILIVYAMLHMLSRMYFPLTDYSVPFIMIRTLIFVITGMMLYQSYKLREIKFQLFILWGGTLYFAFGLISFVTNFKEDFQDMIVYPLEWLMIGSFIDIIFFSIAIGYRNKKQWENINLTLLEDANKVIALQQMVLDKQEELENERARIAADMHDDLGSGLTAISYLSQSALHADTETNLKKIRKTAGELIENMSELIWVMKEENNTLENLAMYIKSYAVEYLDNNGIEARLILPDSFEDINVKGNSRRNLFLSVKESLNNIVRHARASQVTIAMHIDSCFTISISDNGIGLTVQPEKRTGGNGLRNMHKRIESMNGTVEINSENGMQITFRIPIPGRS